MRKPRKRSAPSMATVHSALTNGSSLFLDKSLDQRSAWMRRLRDLIKSHQSDLGGVENISTAELVLIRRASMLCLQLEMMESRWQFQAGGEASTKQIDTYQRTVGALRRLLETLGLQRRA